MKKTQNDEGMSLLVVLIMMTVLLSITAAALMLTGIDSKTTSNLQTGTSALHAADAGMQHAAAMLPYGTDFNALLTGYVAGFPCVPAPPCNGTSSKPTLTYTLGDYTYTVVVDNDTNISGETATSDHNQTVNLTATATGPNSSVRRIAATVMRSASFSPAAAIYIGDSPKCDCKIEFDDNFTVTGIDTKSDGTMGTGAPVPGIGTNDSKTTKKVADALKGKKGAQVTGSGGTPSVTTLADKLDVKQMIQDILALGLAQNTLNKVKDGKYKDSTWGTYDNPMITQLTGSAELKGDISGYGVLIVQGDFKIKETFDFKGLVIVDDNFELHPDKKNGSIMGGLITNADGDSKAHLKIGKNSQIYYSREVLTKIGVQYGNALPTPIQLRGWRETP
jgi:Tfp pilus assembly protein PilX